MYMRFRCIVKVVYSICKCAQNNSVDRRKDFKGICLKMSYVFYTSVFSLDHLSQRCPRPIFGFVEFFLLLLVCPVCTLQCFIFP